MLIPKVEDPFNIFVLHQNRVAHAQNAYIPEDQLPHFLNLVIWGHEHECRLFPEEMKTKQNKNYHISQPGKYIVFFNQYKIFSIKFV